MLEKLRQKNTRYTLATVYVLLLIATLIGVRAFWTPDIIFVALLGFFIIMGDGKRFAYYFLPFIFLLLSYDKLRSLAPYLNSHVHYTEMIRFDRWLFGGTVPTQSLQHWLFPVGQVHWYDFAFYLLYMLHFVVPIVLAVIIWRYQPKYYWRFVISLLVLSYLGFITYVLFPAAPPWLASEEGILQPPIAHISTSIWEALNVGSFSTFYKQLSPNLVAAVPSLHSAYPFLFALIIRKIWGNTWFYVSMLYPITIWFAVVYLGEHYVFDVLAGIAYAALSYWLAPHVVRMLRKAKAKLLSKYRAFK